MILKAFKYRLYPNNEQKTLLNKHFGCSRFVYNWGLETRIKEYQETQKSLSSVELSARLTKLKQELEWLGEVNSQALQMTLRNLDNAYTGFFRQHKSFPKFKKKIGQQSFQCPQKSEVNFEAGTISIIKVKNIKAVLHRKFKGEIKTVTISRTPTGKYFASVLVKTLDNIGKTKKPKIEKAVGIDLGLKHFITLDTGEKVDNPKHLQKSTSELKRLDRWIKRKNKGSKRREKSRLKLAKLYERITNQRNDFMHKLSTRLIRENQSVCLEDLNVQGMLKNHKLARSISSASWAKFVEMLRYKGEWYGCNILQIGRFDPSSKMCSCGVINHSLRLKDRSWICKECGKLHDRDVLAANNIKKFAFDRQSLIENLGNNRVGRTQINAQGEDKVAAFEQWSSKN